MKGYIFIITLLFFSIFKNGYSQNLVPNDSFENYTICPNTFAQIYRADGWFQPHKYPWSNSVNYSSSSDYFNSCDDSTSFVTVPSNQTGYQYPHNGTAFIGIAYYTPQVNGNAYREYAEVRLSDTLIANKKYNLKYYISMANSSRFSVTRFDAYLSQDSLLETSLNLLRIPVTPQIQVLGRINDTLNWVEVTGSFTAIGTENYLTLGNFHDGIDSDSLTEPSNSFTFAYAYYYIDDVSLEEDTITGINELAKADFTIYPNPAKNYLQLKSQQIIQEFNVMDMCRKSLLQLKPLSTYQTIDVSQLKDGIYVVQCKFKNGEVVYKKVVVQH